MSALGKDVQSLLESAKHDALVVAPFMRSEALARLFAYVPAGTQTRVVTRWRLPDLLAGVADLGIYDLVITKGAHLYLRYDLHAKLFAADDQCLVGSANVTETALGWRSPENLELLVTVSRSEPEVVHFEKRLFKGAVRASEALRDRLATFLESHRGFKHTVSGLEPEVTTQLQPDWIPRVRNPEELFSVYNGSTDVGRVALRAMRADLRKMSIVPGMNEHLFREWVAAAISQTPLIQCVVHHIEHKGEMNESDIITFLREFEISPKTVRPREILENLERWLTCFFPAQYQTARESIKLIRAQTVSPQHDDNFGT